MGTTEGIYMLDLDKMEISGTVLTTQNTNTEFGNMVRRGDYVYACEYGKNLHVINCADNSLVKTIPAAVYSIVMSKDGQLWVSTASGVSKVNTESLELEPLSLGTSIGTPASSAGMWNPDGLCASLQQNVIYWTSAEEWTLNKVFKYDIDQNKASVFIDYSSDPDGRAIYGASFRVDPKTDNCYAALVKGWTYNNTVVRKYDNNAQLLEEYAMDNQYWFPEVFVFPDTEDPVTGDIDDVNVTVNGTAETDLSTVCTDTDNLQAAIVKSVENVDDEETATASVSGDKLVVRGLKEGTTAVTLKFCSNGITTTKKINVNVSNPTAINAADNTAEAHETARYTIDGKRIQQPQKGVNIVKFSDGTVKKVTVK